MSKFLRLDTFVVLLFSMFLVFSVTGCQSLAQGDQRSELIAEVAIKVATAKVISRADDPGGKAQRIIDIATQAKQLAEGGTLALVDDLHDEVNQRIDWAALDEGDTLLVQALISGVRAELKVRVDDNLIEGDALIVLQLVLDNIIDAATVYVTPD